MFRIAIGVATHGTIKSKTALSLMELMELPYEFFPIFQHGAYVSVNRERIVAVAKDNQCTHLLFVDHDMQFFSVTVDLLIKHDKDIVAGLYNYRFLPRKKMVRMFGSKAGTIVAEPEEIPDEMFKVAGIGMGCCLIKMSVFDKIEPPYFPMEYDSVGFVTTSEDMGFCEKAIKAGFDIWCDPTLTIKHIGDYEY